MKKVFIMTALTVLAASCQRIEMSKPVQYGSLSVAMDAEVKVDAVTKAAAAEDLNNYTVTVAGNAEGLPKSCLYSAFQPLTLPLGTYTVSAENCTDTEAENGNGCKRLYGSTEVTISETNLTPTAAFTCYVANALVTVEFDKSATDHISDLKVSLTGGTTSGRNVSVTTSGTEVWFNPSTVSWAITGKITSVNKDVNLTGSKELAAKNHLKIIVSVNLDNGQISAAPTITLDTDMNSAEEKNEEFNPYK
ncbi:MAG: DUF4493 domain-containing protein [Candidatus Cryptobacteroides sp.]